MLNFDHGPVPRGPNKQVSILTINCQEVGMQSWHGERRTKALGSAVDLDILFERVENGEGFNHK